MHPIGREDPFRFLSSRMRLFFTIKGSRIEMPGEPGTRSLGCEPDEAQGYDRNGNQEAFSGGSLYSHGEKAYNGGRENLSEDEKGRTGSISLQGG